MKKLFRLFRAVFCPPSSVGCVWIGDIADCDHPCRFILSDGGDGRWTITSSRRIRGSCETVPRRAEELVRRDESVDLQIKTMRSYQRWRLSRRDALVWDSPSRGWVLMAHGSWVR